MGNVVAAAVLVVALVAGPGGPVRADPPRPAAGNGAGWSAAGGTLTWRSPQLLMGDAAVEFYAGDRLLGRPETADHRTFRLRLPAGADPADLQVRAGGRRLDAPPPRDRRQATVPPPSAPPPSAPSPPGPVDPGMPGPYRPITGEYTLPGLPVPGYPAAVEMQAVVVAPQGAAGPRPLALFLHGRHFTCFRGDDVGQTTGEWPCPAGRDAVPSYRGYLRAQRLLASQGYVTVSVSANGVNGQDDRDEDYGAQARSSLIRQHLAHWADWAGAGRSTAPAIVRSAPRADLSRVFLMGHSRGGEGVNRAAMDSLTPPPAAQDAYRGEVRWTIRGTLLIGPTLFGQNPVPDVPSATILPGCDGDVADLHGQMYVDATRGVSTGRALHSALYMVGANHNYFNTEWTPGQSIAPSTDDWGHGSESPDAVCSPGTPTRLTADQQQAAGATYIAAAARLFVGGDDRVRPLLDGSGVRAPSADPARVLSHAIGANRTPVAIPEPAKLTVQGGRLCRQVDDDPEQTCLPGDEWSTPSPHFAGFGGLPDEPGRYAVAMSWSTAGQTVSLRPKRAERVHGELTMRIVVPPNSTGTRFRVAATDTGGRRTDLGEVRIDGLPGTELVSPYWAQEVRVPLKGVTSLARLDLTPRTAGGSAWLIDAWGYRPGTPAPRPVGLPRIDVGGLSVPEGDAGTRTHQVPVRITGRGPGQVRVFVVDSLTNELRSWVATIRPGTRTIRVPVEVAGNTRYDEGTQSVVGVKAVQGTVVGDYLGVVEVEDDDPPPVVRVTPVAATVAEGGTLTWRITLSEPVDMVIWAFGAVRPPAAGAELSTTDVDPAWFAGAAWEDALPSRPLSETSLRLYGGVAPGQTSADITVPTVTDDAAEPDEFIQFDLSASVRDAPPLGTITGRVTD